MNNYQLSSHRDKQIIYALSLSAFTSEQLTVLYFPGKAGYRKCCQRLKYLREHELIHLIKRPFFDMPNVYYLDKEPALYALTHIIAVSWIYIWISKRFEVEYWETEVVFKTLRFDAICKLKDGRWLFIEYDRPTSNHYFKKVEQCTELYEKEGKPGSDLLMKLGNPNKFPRTVVVTDGVKRRVNIMAMIKDKTKNPHGLGYGLYPDKPSEIYLYSEILKEVHLCK